MDQSDTKQKDTSVIEFSPIFEQSMDGFINEMSVDHPHFASILRNERLPDFQRNIKVLWHEFQEELADKNKGSQNEEIQQILQQEDPDEEFSEAIGEGMAELEYISNLEILSSMKQFALEVEQELSINPDAIFIFETDYYEESSETYFAKIVLQMIPPQFQERIRLSRKMTSAEKAQLVDQQKLVFYRFDDSSNSGSQVTASIRTSIRLFEKYNKLMDFRIRLIAGSSGISAHVIKRVEEWLNEDNDRSTDYTINIQNIYTNKRIEISYKGHVATWGTSIVFAHKIQDNLPNLFISLSSDHRRNRPHLFRLDEDIIPAYKMKKT